MPKRKETGQKATGRKVTNRMANPEEAAKIKQAIAEEDACAQEQIAEAREVLAQLRSARIAVDHLNAERQRQGLSLAAIENRTGMTRSSISNLENHRARNPTVRTLARYAAALGMQLDIRLTRGH